MVTPLALVLAVAIGLLLGVLGGGGSILAVPLLTLVVGLDDARAIATSLVTVAVAAAAAVVPNALAGHVRWRAGLPFAAMGMVGAFLGGRAAGHLPPGLLAGGFLAVMVVTAVATLRGRRTEATAVARPGWHTLRDGLGVGLVTGLVGAGGGFVIVPALLALGRMSMRDAVGTSLLVIALNATAGALGHAGQGALVPGVVVPVTIAAAAGALVGSAIGGRIAPEALRRGFGVFVLVVAAVQVGARLVP